jgi:hypothetical protein
VICMGCEREDHSVGYLKIMEGIKKDRTGNIFPLYREVLVCSNCRKFIIQDHLKKVG